MGTTTKLNSLFSRKFFAVRNVVVNEAGILRRILVALFESGETQGDHQTIPFVARPNEILTDGIEREIVQRTSMGNSSPRW